MKWWKWIGLAGVFGIAEGGNAVARPPRPRGTYTAEQITARLHQRLTAARRRD
ncbi:hypothetical protein [Nocardioides jejuensis]|uniref:hypothetical protein n=1 Tax=Nocardioides jejuensis TaxID=2502782 RepID=UPI001404D115|nr:hypothetical protein [Nocardioides jejuensis]